LIVAIQTLVPYLVVVSHVIFAFILLSLFFRRSWGRPVANFVGKYAIPLAFVAALAALLGSLFYSEVIGYEPCVLCWWQRVFLYPQVLIFGIALWKRDTSPFLYAVPLTVFSALLSTYHSYVYLGGKSLLPCTALGGACSKVYVLEFGYVTIPLMALTIAFFIFLLAWSHRIYKNENRHA
jgi:disulfide bond formation protein DsbB